MAATGKPSSIRRDTQAWTMKTELLRRALLAALLSGTLLGARAHSSASDASLLSALPIAVSVAAPVMILSAGATLTVESVGDRNPGDEP